MGPGPQAESWLEGSGGGTHSPALVKFWGLLETAVSLKKSGVPSLSLHAFTTQRESTSRPHHQRPCSPPEPDCRRPPDSQLPALASTC